MFKIVLIANLTSFRVEKISNLNFLAAFYPECKFKTARYCPDQSARKITLNSPQGDEKVVVERFLKIAGLYHRKREIFREKMIKFRPKNSTCRENVGPHCNRNLSVLQDLPTTTFTIVVLRFFVDLSGAASGRRISWMLAKSSRTGTTALAGKENSFFGLCVCYSAVFSTRRNQSSSLNADFFYLAVITRLSTLGPFAPRVLRFWALNLGDNFLGRICTHVCPF